MNAQDSKAATTAQSIVTPPSQLRTSQMLRMSALWFGLEFFWISQLIIVMPERVVHFVPHAHRAMYLGLLRGCGPFIVIATQLTVGFISDHAYSRLGRRRPFIIFGMLWACAAIAFFFLAPSYWWLFAAYMVLEGTINVASVPFQSLLPDLVPEKQHARAGAIMGLMHMAGYFVGLIAIMVVRVAFADKTIVILGDMKPGGYMLLLGAYLVFLLLAMLVTVLGTDEQRWAQAARKTISGAARSFYVMPGVLVRFAKTAPTLLGCILHDYLKLDLRSQPNFCWLAASRFTIYLGYNTFLTYLFFYVPANLNGTAWLASMGLGKEFEQAILPAILLFFILGGFVGNVLSAPLAERRGKIWVIASGMVLAGVMLIPLIFTHGVWIAVTCGMLLGCGWGAFIAADWAFACTLMPKQQAGSYMGIWDVTTLLPQIIAPVIAGPLFDGIVNARLADYTSRLGVEAGKLAADALANQWVFATILVYFAIGLVLLRKVREPRVA